MKSPAVLGLLIVLAVCAGIIMVRNIGLFLGMELALYDSFLRFHPRLQESNSRILLLTISEADIRRLGEWPMTDQTMARMLKNVLDHKPDVIGLDIYRDIPVLPGSWRLTELFSDNRNIVTVRRLADDHSPGIPPPFMAGKDNPVGFGNIVADTEGAVRRGLLFASESGTTYYSFPLRVALVYLKSRGIVPEADETNPEYMRLGETTFVPLMPDAGGYVGADAGGYQFLLDFSGIRSPFETVSLTRALSNDLAPEKIRGKIVIIGATAESLKDPIHVPACRLGSIGRTVHGVELNAVAINQIVGAAMDSRKPMAWFGKAYEWGWIVFWGLAGYLTGLLGRSFAKFLFCAMIALAFTFGSAFMAFLGGYWIPVGPPAMAFAISAAMVTAYMSFRVKMQREKLMRIFSSHVSEKVAETLWEQRNRFMEDGRPRPQKLTATVLFTDLKGFTSVSEMMAPHELAGWLNEYMSAMVDVVEARGGVVNKYIGDAIMALFGVPVARSNEDEIAEDAENAVWCAVEMGKRLEELNREWRSRGHATVKMRVGIFTGPLVACCLGSEKRLEYTVLGDTVNIASRLESYDKDFAPDSACRILVGESTYNRLAGRFVAEPLSGVSLKGKREKINIYNILGPNL